jgi:cellulose synthase/poly-beta-1,6-N-acetylglucosamine synthase-like glycosyltransferase
VKIAFAVAIAWLVYVYAGYPLILVILAWWRGVRLVSSEGHLPSVSVLIAARNEEQDIAWKIAETLALEYPQEKLEILVASDASDDRTDEIVASFYAAPVTLIRMKQRGGKVRALNRLAEIARGEILFFTDANAHVRPNALRLLVRHFTDARVGCVTGNTLSLLVGKVQAVTDTAGLYRRYESMLRSLESALGSVLNCDGAVFCMRAALFERLSPELANDLETPMRLGAAGWKVIYEPHALVFERDSSSPAEELRRQRRMCAQGMAAMFLLPGVFGGLRGWQFVSHKLSRWLSLIPMAVLVVATAVLAPSSTFFAGVLVLQAIFYGMAISGLAMALSHRQTVRAVSIPFYIMLGLVAAQIGVVDALKGRRFDVWESPALSRGDTSASGMLASKERGSRESSRTLSAGTPMPPLDAGGTE